jgi:[glutamine synthetase] adenylyltransferase / [glutamine synthetase]-adenylyl-L-tyrosine phosphorylase
VELEFIAQFLQLLHAHAFPELLQTNTMAAFDGFGRSGILGGGDAQTLREALRLFHRLTQVLRLCVVGTFEPDHALTGLNRAIARAANVATVSMAEDLLREQQGKVADLFDRIVGDPNP